MKLVYIVRMGNDIVFAGLTLESVYDYLKEDFKPLPYYDVYSLQIIHQDEFSGFNIYNLKMYNENTCSYDLIDDYTLVIGGLDGFDFDWKGKIY